MATGKIRVGLVGMDHWYIGRSILHELSQSDRAQAVVVAHSSEQYGRPEAAQYGVEFATDYLSVATRPDVDLVVTACPSAINPDVVIAAAGAGKPVLSVKPFAMNLERANQVVQAVKAAGTPFISYETYDRVNPSFQRLREWVQSGRFGRIMTAMTIQRATLEGAARPWPDAPIGPTFWRDPKQVPGGGWIDHSIYAIDHLRWLMGAEVTRIGGVVANVKHTTEPLEDWGSAFVTFSNGTIATVEVTWHGEPGVESSNQFHLMGTAGQFRQLGWNGPIEIVDYAGDKQWHPAPMPEGRGSVLAHMFDIMDGKAQPIATIDDSLANLTACLTFYQAAREGRFRNL
jgi:predicted dehydrogenase